MNPYVLWQLGETPETTEINSSQKLDELLDNLDSKAKKNKMPFSVQMCLNDESALMITIGACISHMEFYAKSHHPPIVISIGDWDDGQPDEVFIALHGGITSTIQKKSCVLIENARHAVRQYIETGKRPTNVSWTDEL